MWLLDVNMPKKAGSLLGEFGIEAHSADDRGWGGLTNGALVEAAIQAVSDVSLRVIASSASLPPAR